METVLKSKLMRLGAYQCPTYFITNKKIILRSNTISCSRNSYWTFWVFSAWGT